MPDQEIYNQELVELSCCYKINNDWWSKTFEWDLKVVSVGDCVMQIQERRFSGVGAIHDCVSKFY